MPAEGMNRAKACFMYSRPMPFIFYRAEISSQFADNFHINSLNCLRNFSYNNIKVGYDLLLFFDFNDSKLHVFEESNLKTSIYRHFLCLLIFYKIFYKIINKSPDLLIIKIIISWSLNSKTVAYESFFLYLYCIHLKKTLG